MSSIISIEDINFLAQQSAGQMNLILSGMTTLMQDSDAKIEQMESQKWYQRMVKTVFGKNKATKEEVAKNHDKLTSYMAEAIAELYNRQCVDQKILLSLAANLNAIYAEHIQLKQFLGAFVVKLNEKMESIDNFHMLNTEIQQGVYSDVSPIISICRVLSQMDKRCIQEYRKMNILRRSMAAQNILSSEMISLKDCLLSITEIQPEEAGQVYLELSSIRGNFMAGIILEMMDQYYFLPDIARRAKNKNALVQSVIEAEQLDPSMTLSADEIFDDFVNSKLDMLEGTDPISTMQYDVRLAEAEKLFLNYQLAEAFEIFNTLAEMGNGRAMFFLGEYYISGYGIVEKDEEKTGEWRRKGYEAGDVLAASYLLINNEIDNDSMNDEIFHAVLNLAKNGDIIAQCAVADLYNDLYDNEDEALYWFRLSADGGYWKAMYELGLEYCFEDNDAEAVGWFRKAAEIGYELAMYTLADMLCYGGNGVEQDSVEADKWYQKAMALRNKEDLCGDADEDENDEERFEPNELVSLYQGLDASVGDDDVSEMISSKVEYYLGSESSCVTYTGYIGYGLREKAKKHIVDKSDAISGVAGAALGFAIGGLGGAFIGKMLGDKEKSEQAFTCDVDDIIAIVDASTFNNCKDGLVFTKKGVFFSQTGDVSIYIEYSDIYEASGTTGFLGGKLEVERYFGSNFTWTDTIIPKNKVAKLLNELKNI